MHRLLIIQVGGTATLRWTFGAFFRAFQSMLADTHSANFCQARLRASRIEQRIPFVRYERTFVSN